jgi:HD-GYP domain-containing protein (c-di-GMP phosphodiesterase class II)
MTEPKPPQSDLLREMHETGKAEDLETQVQDQGRNLVNRFFMFYRTGALHTLENEATRRACEAVREVVVALKDLTGKIGLSAVGDSFYLNKTLLKTDFSTFENFRFLTVLFEKLNISGFSFSDVPETEEFLTFLERLHKSGGDPNDPAWIGNSPFSSIQILKRRESEEVATEVISREDRTDPEYLLRIYFKTVMTLENFFQALQKGEMESLRLMQRLAHEFIDAVGESVTTLLRLTQFHSREHDLAFHSANVMLYSVLIGRELEFTRHQLADLASSALLHDIGRIQIPREILEKSDRLRPSDWKQLEQSNTYSVVQLLRVQSFNESALRRLLVAYEHAFAIDPEKKDRKPTLFARIVAIARAYDAMVSPKAYRDPLLPTEAFKLMNKEAGKKFDATLLQIFFHLLTEYPPGTLVHLKSGEVGIVTDSGDQRSDHSRPHVMVLYDASGKKTTPREIDLGKDVSAKIAGSLDSTRFGINVMAYLFSRS